MNLSARPRPVSKLTAIILAVAGLVFLAVVPVSRAMFDIALITTLAATVVAHVRDAAHLRAVTVILRLGLVLAGLRIVGTLALSPGDEAIGYGIAGGVGELVAGGNALIGTVACAVTLCVLVVVSRRRHAPASDALLAGTSLALSVAAAGALVQWGPVSFEDALYAMPYACGIAIALSLPAVIVCCRHQGPISAA